MATRARTYFKGQNGFQPQPLMGLALLVAAADAVKTVDQAQACVDLADILVDPKNRLVAKNTVTRNRAKEYLCRAVKMNHPGALEKLWQVTHPEKPTKHQAELIVADENPARSLLLRLVCTDTVPFPS